MTGVDYWKSAGNEGITTWNYTTESTAFNMQCTFLNQSVVIFNRSF